MVCLIFVISIDVRRIRIRRERCNFETVRFTLDTYICSRNDLIDPITSSRIDTGNMSTHPFQTRKMWDFRELGFNLRYPPYEKEKYQGIHRGHFGWTIHFLISRINWGRNITCPSRRIKKKRAKEIRLPTLSYCGNYFLILLAKTTVRETDRERERNRQTGSKRNIKRSLVTEVAFPCNKKWKAPGRC